MMITVYIALAVIMAAAAIYFAAISQEFCKFLAGAFFVSSGTLFYFYLTGVSVPLWGTNFIQSPRIAVLRSVVHAIFFLVTFYLGFIRKSMQSK